MKKILCLILVVALVACGAFAIVKGNTASQLQASLDTVNATAADLQSQLDEANARIAELEAAEEVLAETEAPAEEEEAPAEASADADLQALIDLYKPYYDAQVVVEYNGGVIMKEEVMDIYELYEQSAAQYGIDLATYGMDTQYKELSAQKALEEAIVFQQAAALGLDQLDESTAAGLAEQAHSSFESYVEAVSASFEGDDVTEEEVREKAVSYLESLGYTEEYMLETITENYITEQVYNHVTAGVSVSEEDVKAAYDALVTEQETSFADDAAYNDARNNGEQIVWQPEGYRAVKQVLIKFSDEQDATYTELQSTLTALQSELEAAQTPAETEEPAEEAADSAETEEPAETEETAEAEEVAETRSVEEIEADIAAVEAELEALYAELRVEADEVVEKFNAGTPFADLIAEHNDDPGMSNEPTATNGYAVAADSTTWDPTFTAGAMSIESVGGISEPINGSYGVYIIYYESDIPAGPVAYEEVSEAIAATALEDKISQTYNDAVVAWLADAEPVYHYDNLAN